MTKEQQQRANELTKEIDGKKGALSRLNQITDSIKKDNCCGNGLKMEGWSGWFYLKNTQFSLTFVAIAKAECEQQLKDLEAEFAAL